MTVSKKAKEKEFSGTSVFWPIEKGSHLSIPEVIKGVQSLIERQHKGKEVKIWQVITNEIDYRELSFNDGPNAVYLSYRETENPINVYHKKYLEIHFWVEILKPTN